MKNLMEKDNLNPKNILERIKAPTPAYWKKVRNSMIVIGGVSGIILMAPVAFPAILMTIASYGAVVGTVGTFLSQTAKK